MHALDTWQPAPRLIYTLKKYAQAASAHWRRKAMPSCAVPPASILGPLGPPKKARAIEMTRAGIHASMALALLARRGAQAHTPVPHGGGEAQLCRRGGLASCTHPCSQGCPSLAVECGHDAALAPRNNHQQRGADDEVVGILHKGLPSVVTGLQRHLRHAPAAPCSWDHVHRAHTTPCHAEQVLRAEREGGEEQQGQGGASARHEAEDLSKS
mmetsp:Transcript_58080/g.149528  ORF Transcript_58080/g.149528 Transcript_58080/m.149528 type:complete len:212 (+) Transcript_58080:62-697(+)